MAEREVVSTEMQAWTPDAETTVKRGISVKRVFTKPGAPPLEDLEWELRTASIQNERAR